LKKNNNIDFRKKVKFNLLIVSKKEYVYKNMHKKVINIWKKTEWIKLKKKY
jgi:hypothetical protein